MDTVPLKPLNRFNSNTSASLVVLGLPLGKQFLLRSYSLLLVAGDCCDFLGFKPVDSRKTKVVSKRYSVPWGFGKATSRKSGPSFFATFVRSSMLEFGIPT